MELYITDSTMTSYKLPQNIDNGKLTYTIPADQWEMGTSIDASTGELTTDVNKATSPILKFIRGFDTINIITIRTIQVMLFFYDKNMNFIQDMYQQNLLNSTTPNWRNNNDFINLTDGTSDAIYFRIVLSDKTEIPSSGITYCYKNKYTKLNITYDTWTPQVIDNSTGQPSTVDTSYRFHSDFIKIPYNKTRVALVSRMTKSRNSNFFIYEYDIDKNFIQPLNTDLKTYRTFILLNENTKYIRPMTEWDYTIDSAAYRYVLLFN